MRLAGTGRSGACPHSQVRLTESWRPRIRRLGLAEPGEPAAWDRYPAAVGALGKAELDALVEEATVDCYGEDEQVTGLYTMIEDNLALPFETRILDVNVTVKDIKLSDDGRIVALCARAGAEQAISLLNLPLPEPLPGGAEWIAAYRHWAG